MDGFEALHRSRQEFDRRLRSVGSDDWDRPTPCSEWNVRDLVNHVIGGCRRYTMLLHGASPEETNALRALDHLGADPVESFVSAADEMTAAFREPGALSRAVHHPAGDRSGEVLLGMRVLDFAVHGWDLARGIGADETLDPELVSLLWEILSPMAPAMDEGAYFKPSSGALGADAPLQDRLLDLTGRQP